MRLARCAAACGCGGGEPLRAPTALRVAAAAAAVRRASSHTQRPPSSTTSTTQPSAPRGHKLLRPSSGSAGIRAATDLIARGHVADGVHCLKKLLRLWQSRRPPQAVDIAALDEALHRPGVSQRQRAREALELVANIDAPVNDALRHASTLRQILRRGRQRTLASIHAHLQALPDPELTAVYASNRIVSPWLLGRSRDAGYDAIEQLVRLLKASPYSHRGRVYSNAVGQLLRYVGSTRDIAADARKDGATAAAPPTPWLSRAELEALGREAVAVTHAALRRMARAQHNCRAKHALPPRPQTFAQGYSVLIRRGAGAGHVSPKYAEALVDELVQELHGVITPNVSHALLMVYQQQERQTGGGRAAAAAAAELVVAAFDRLEARGACFDELGYNVLLHALAVLGRADDAERAMAQMRAQNRPPDAYSYAALIHALRVGGHAPEDAERALRDAESAADAAAATALSPTRFVDTAVYNNLAALYVERGMADAALEVYERMRRRAGLRMDPRSIEAVVSAHLRRFDVDAARDALLRHHRGGAAAAAEAAPEEAAVPTARAFAAVAAESGDTGVARALLDDAARAGVALSVPQQQKALVGVAFDDSAASLIHAYGARGDGAAALWVFDALCCGLGGASPGLTVGPRPGGRGHRGGDANDGDGLAMALSAAFRALAAVGDVASVRRLSAFASSSALFAPPLRRATLMAAPLALAEASSRVGDVATTSRALLDAAGAGACLGVGAVNALLRCGVLSADAAAHALRTCGCGTHADAETLRLLFRAVGGDVGRLTRLVSVGLGGAAGAFADILHNAGVVELTGDPSRSSPLAVAHSRHVGAKEVQAAISEAFDELSSMNGLAAPGNSDDSEGSAAGKRVDGASEARREAFVLLDACMQSAKKFGPTAKTWALVDGELRALNTVMATLRTAEQRRRVS